MTVICQVSAQVLEGVKPEVNDKAAGKETTDIDREIGFSKWEADGEVENEHQEQYAGNRHGAQAEPLFHAPAPGMSPSENSHADRCRRRGLLHSIML